MNLNRASYKYFVLVLITELSFVRYGGGVFVVDQISQKSSSTFLDSSHHFMPDLKTTTRQGVSVIRHS